MSDSLSRPLLARDAAQQGDAGFAQTGTVDWTKMSGMAISFSIDTLSRLSKAGVEALTLHAALIMFGRTGISTIGESRIQLALDKLTPFPSLNKALWFGFGVKHIIHSLRETREGVSCIAICASLTEMYSTTFSAKVLRELFLLQGPPEDLTPALRQWGALVQACAGVLAPTEFSLYLNKLSLLYFEADRRPLRLPSTPQAVASALQGMFNVAIGKLDSIQIQGGTDCAWLATVAHWILGLSTEVQSGSGEVIYRPGGPDVNKSRAGRSQVIVHYDLQVSSSVQVWRQVYTIPTGRALLSWKHISSEMLTFGRLSWDTCLTSTFGKPMRSLLTCLAPLTGAYLGASAKLVAVAKGEMGKHLQSAEVNNALSFLVFESPMPVNRATSSHGFCIAAMDLLPEVGLSSPIMSSMKAASALSYIDAARKYSSTLTELKASCQCLMCSNRSLERKEIVPTYDEYCLVVLACTIGNLIRILACCSEQSLSENRPTASGLAMLFGQLHLKVQESSCREIANDVNEIGRYKFQTCASEYILDIVQCLFTGRENNENLIPDIPRSAISFGGLCFYLNTVCEVTADANRVGMVHFMPGTIQWNNFVYETAVDVGKDGRPDVPDERYPATSSRVVEAPAHLDVQDSSSDDLTTSLVVEERLEGSMSSLLVYHSFHGKNGRFNVGPCDIVARVWSATRIRSCHGEQCGPLVGYRGLVVEGEGLVDTELISSSQDVPILRHLGTNVPAIWIALMQTYARMSSRPAEEAPSLGVLFNSLQGSQCFRCCVANAASSWDSFLHGRARGRQVCIVHNTAINNN